MNTNSVGKDYRPAFGSIKGEKVTDKFNEVSKDSHMKIIQDGNSVIEAEVDDSFCYVMDVDDNKDLKLRMDNMGTLYAVNKDSNGETSVEIKNAVHKEYIGDVQKALEQFPADQKIASIQIAGVSGDPSDKYLVNLQGMNGNTVTDYDYNVFTKKLHKHGSYNVPGQDK